MKASPDVERWFASGAFPMEPLMRAVRDVVLRADERMTEYIKYGTLAFGYEGDFATFVQTKDRRRVSLMLNRGARLRGDFPHLEGDGPSARFVRFADPADVEDRAGELRSIVGAWCAMVTPDSEPG